MVFGGGGNDIIVANAGETAAASDGNNIVFGDHGLVDYLAEELHPAGGHHAARTDRPSTHDIDRIWSIAEATSMGGHDRITTGRGNDIILGGTGDDIILAGDGSNIVIGDNAVLTAAPFDYPATPYAVHEFALCSIATIGFADEDGGNDTVNGGSGNDVLFGGGGGDTIYAGAGDDLVFGDHGRIECKNGMPFIPEISLRPICWNCFPESGFLLFEATNTTGAQGWGNDVLFGEDGSDVLMGQQGHDVLYGGNGDDILIGGSNVAGAHDGNDRIDGGGGHDAIAGDNAEICFRPDAIDVRMRSLDGTVIYGITPGVDDGLLLVGIANTGNAINTAQPWVNAKNDPRYVARTVTNGVLDKNSGHAEYVIRLLDHAEGTSPLLYGNDYIAGGAGEDEIFGQLGNDVIQGDGTIGLGSSLSLRGSYADSLAAAQLSLTRADGTTVAITGFTEYGANRGAVPTALADFGFNMDPGQDLTVLASFEGRFDGDDYIEGNGGNDVIFGNRGQDDIVGGSSDLFGLVLATQRPDGSDLLFGGAGTDIARNDIGDATTGTSPGSSVADLILNARGGHAHDADVIVGDNGRILRLVGVNAGTEAQRGNADSLQATGVSSTGGFLNYNYDIYGSNTDDGRTGLGVGDGRDGGGYGDDGNALTYNRIVVRGVSFLDYTPGGIDVSADAANDRGAGDEIHGESGDDQIHGMKGNDVLFGDGQDDDLVGGYGNDWISGGTGNDGVIGDDGRIMTSRNATAYGEALFGVARLLPDNGDTRSFNGNMMNEAIATPGSIQQAMVNVADELKKAVNITPFSFDALFVGNADEFTSSNKKTIDYLGRSGATNADDVIFGGLGSDWLHGGSGDDAISGGEALALAYTQVYDANGVLVGVTRSDWSRPYNAGDMLRFNPDDPDGWHADRTRRAGEFALYDEYDPLRKITLNPDGTANKTDAGGLEWFLNFTMAEGSFVPGGTVTSTGQTINYAPTYNDGNDRIFGDL
ncbi:MAG TPA: hypothetical protein VEZ89_03735, partial [Rubrivivax sp.]|nr:hypothetical protein [Rubrivivax sp.]